MKLLKSREPSIENDTDLRHQYLLWCQGESDGDHHTSADEYTKQFKRALAAAYSNFDNATDPDLIDCFIYQVNSEQKRYKYLLQKAKEMEASSE